MKRVPALVVIAALVLVGLLTHYWLKVRSDEQSDALFKTAASRWNLDPSLYRGLGRRHLPNQVGSRLWSREAPDGVDQIEVFEAEGLVCRALKVAGSSEWRSLGCLELQ